MSFLPFFPSLRQELGRTDRAEIEGWTGVIFGSAPLVAAFMGPIWGSIGDRLGRKLMVVRALISITLFVGMMGFARTPLQLLFLRLGQGAFSGFVPPSITLVSVIAPKGVQGRVAGSLQTSLAAGSIVGPLLGALIGSHFGIRSVFFFVSLASGISALSIALFAFEDPCLRASQQGFSPASILSGTWRELRELLGDARVRFAFILLFLVQAGVGSTNPLMELHVEDLWRGDPARVPQLTAYLFTSLAAAILIATPLWGRYGDRVGHQKSLTRAAALGGIALLLHWIAPIYAALLGVRVLLGIASSGVNASCFAVAANATTVERRGIAIGSAFSARAFAVSLGALSGGGLASLFGIHSLFWGGGLIILVALFVMRRPGD